MFGNWDLKDYQQKNKHFMFDSDFDEYKPRDYHKEEVEGNQSWSGGHLDYIPSKLNLSMPPLPGILKNMIENYWRSAKPSVSATRGPVTAGGHRGPAGPGTGHQAFVAKPVPVVRSAAFATQAQLSPHLKDGFAKDWDKHREIPRVNAFSFRGDTRAPDSIRKDGGFQPPISRTDDYYVSKVVFPQFRDYLKDKAGVDVIEADVRKVMQGTSKMDKDLVFHYAVWRAVVERESLHLGRMLAEEALKGFISTSKAVTIAKGFARPGGWAYVLRVDGGYHLPDKGSHAWTTIFGEQEIAFPGSIAWAEVMGFRQIGPDKKFFGPVYLRQMFPMVEPKAAHEAFRLLSGKKQ